MTATKRVLTVILRLLATGRAKRGSMLIDTLFGAALIGIVVTSLFLAFSLANRIALRTKHIAIAKNVAEAEVETIRRTNFDSLSPGTTNATAAALPNGQKQVALAYFDPPSNKVFAVTVTVTWRERQGTETYRLSTLATKGGTGK